jgi:hypothetical protein
VYDRIISMISAGNREAATALIARMLGTGECITWDEGQRVDPEESGSLMSCWAKVGDTGPCYWTENEHIAKSTPMTRTAPLGRGRPLGHHARLDQGRGRFQNPGHWGFPSLGRDHAKSRLRVISIFREIDSENRL